MKRPLLLLTSLLLLSGCNLISQLLSPYKVNLTVQTPTFSYRAASGGEWANVPDIALSGKAMLIDGSNAIKGSVDWNGGMVAKIPAEGGTQHAKVQIVSGDVIAEGESSLVHVVADTDLSVRAIPVIKRLFIVPPTGTVSANSTIDLEYWVMTNLYRIMPTGSWYDATTKIVSGDANILLNGSDKIRLKLGSAGTVQVEITVSNSLTSAIKQTVSIVVQ